MVGHRHRRRHWGSFRYALSNPSHWGTIVVFMSRFRVGGGVGVGVEHWWGSVGLGGLESRH